MFQKATKKESKLRMALSGPSGSGKTYTSLVFAQALANGGKVAVVDTEHGSASKYADEFDFDVAEMSNFHPSNYVKAINAAAEAGYSVVVLDSISHAWNGKGGILDMVGGNFSKWKDVAPIEQKFIEAIISSSVHIIATMRAKAQYEVERNERGRAAPKKVGMGAIQRDGMEYEFDITCMMDVSNNLTVEKTRCKAINGTRVNQPDGDFMKPIISWLGHETPDPVPTLSDVPEMDPNGPVDGGEFDDIPGAMEEKRQPKSKVSAAFVQFQQAVKALFPKDAADARHYLIKCYTLKATPSNVRTSSKDLSDDELAVITRAINSNPSVYMDRYAAHVEAQILERNKENEGISQ